jgi:hypothetical protein
MQVNDVFVDIGTVQLYLYVCSCSLGSAPGHADLGFRQLVISVSNWPDIPKPNSDLIPTLTGENLLSGRNV